MDLIKRKQEKIVAVNGAGWPSQAKKSSADHASYAQKTLYIYCPCRELEGTEYLDQICQEVYQGNWTNFLEAFVRCPTHIWCPIWISRNYKMLNPRDEVPAQKKNGDALCSMIRRKNCERKSLSQQVETNQTSLKQRLPMRTRDHQRTRKRTHMHPQFFWLDNLRCKKMPRTLKNT